VAFVHKHRELLRTTVVPPPSLAVEIDWLHPLAEGLISYYAPGYSLADLTGIGPLLTADTGALIAASDLGPVHVSSGSSATLYSSSIPQVWRLTGNGSLFWAGRTIAAPSSYAQFTGLAYDNQGNNPPFYCYSISDTGTGNFGFLYGSGDNFVVFSFGILFVSCCVLF